jgi:putative Holliday junction resolvase
VRALGIDYGERRIGVALSDPTGTLATPLTTLTQRRGKRPPVGELERIARDAEVAQIVIGLPLSLAGDETERCAAVRKIGDALAARLGVPVAYVDERLTTVRATKLVRGSGLPKGEREQKERVDAAAAALILQSWLDRTRSS